MGGFHVLVTSGSLAAYVHGCNIYLRDLSGRPLILQQLLHRMYSLSLKRTAASGVGEVYSVTTDVVADGSCKGPTEVLAALHSSAPNFCIFQHRIQHTIPTLIHHHCNARSSSNN